MAVAFSQDGKYDLVQTSTPRFKSTVAKFIHGLRFWKGPNAAFQETRKKGWGKKAMKGREASNAAVMLSKACQRNQPQLITLLATKGVDLNMPPTGRSVPPLLVACQLGNFDCVLALLDGGATAQINDLTNGETPLHTACGKGNTSIGQLLLEKGADINAATFWQGETPLHRAALSGSLQTAKCILNHNNCGVCSQNFNNGRAGVNIEDQTGRTPLHDACAKGFIDMVLLLLEAGAKVNIVDNETRSTPLIHAIEGGHIEIALLLLSRGANPFATEEVFGQTPLHVSCKVGTNCITKKLLRLGAQRNERDRVLGRTPLHLAVEEGWYKMTKLMLRGENANVDSQDRIIGLAPLHTGVEAALCQPSNSSEREKYIRVLKVLFDSGADINAIDGGKGFSALHQATIACDTDMIKFLAQNGADINNKDALGLVPLHHAVQHENSDVAHALIQEGCDVYARNPVSGSYPLHMAARKGCMHTARILVDHGGASVFDEDMKHHTPVRKAVLLLFKFV